MLNRKETDIKNALETVLRHTRISVSDDDGTSVTLNALLENDKANPEIRGFAQAEFQNYMEQLIKLKRPNDINTEATATALGHAREHLGEFLGNLIYEHPEFAHRPEGDFHEAVDKLTVEWGAKAMAIIDTQANQFMSAQERIMRTDAARAR